jgi:hypothetical protein
MPTAARAANRMRIMVLPDTFWPANARGGLSV